MRHSVLLITVMLALLPMVGVAQERQDSVQWYDRVHQLEGITIDKKREAYSRKNNPAVELMKKVIGHKRMTDPTKKAYNKNKKKKKQKIKINVNLS